ncbi:MAG: acyltransferase family protein [Actinobacteria bacterium]|nr:acyltransferase family protein [Actinomycetota bacterium]
MADDPTTGSDDTTPGTRTAEIVPLRLPPVAEEPEPVHDPRLGDVDEFGRSERVREVARKAYDPLYRNWFRAEWDGLDKIPTSGGALLVANHAGAIPSDAPVIMHGIETELDRPVYGLADQFFKGAPFLGTLWARGGGVVGHPDNAYRVLRERKELALVFPEGTKGTSKTYNERYRLRRFGRGGFVEIAMRAGVPIIPIAVVGNEEAMPVLFKLPSVAKAVGLPYFPITANMAFGPLALLPFPAKFKLRVLDPITFDVPPDQPRYSRSLIMDESERIRQEIQEALFDMLRQRRSVWFG